MARSSVTLTVGELNEYVRRSLASDPMLRSICLRGEISNLKRHVSGHWYFSLKDQQSAISCAMFRQAAITVRFSPKDGQQVRLYGSVGLYPKTGQYQFYAEAMEPDGEGAMYALFEQRKAMFAAEGLFDPALKKPIPLLPRAIGIVTSKTGAVVHDIARVAWRRNPGMPLYLCPVKVQGEGAAEEIAAGIALLSRIPELEVLIIGRGGGSMEDLWAFNEEVVARAVANCPVPVISAVGHETDVTIADFVADMRAPTPSAAAELAVQSQEVLRHEITARTGRMERAWVTWCSLNAMRISQTERRIAAYHPEMRTQQMETRLRQAMQQMRYAYSRSLTQKEHALSENLLRLRSASPETVLARGYAIVTKSDTIIPRAATLKAQDNIQLWMQDGAVDAAVVTTKRGERLWQQPKKKKQ